MWALAIVGLMPYMLSLYWGLAIWAVMVTLLPVPMPQAFKDAVKLSAARGKLWSIRPTTLGALNNMAVPQAWFSHFYAIGMACCTALVLVCSSTVHAHGFSRAVGPETYVALTLFLLHLLRRLLETCCMMVYPADARMHVIAYAFGMSYYLVAPLSIAHDAFYGPADQPDSLGGWWASTAGTGSDVMGSVWAAASALVSGIQVAPAVLQAGVAAIVGKAPLMGVLGVAVMIGGFIIQYHSHRVLARLASGSTGKAGRKAAASAAESENASGPGMQSEHAMTPGRSGSVTTRRMAAAAAAQSGQAAGNEDKTDQAGGRSVVSQSSKRQQAAPRHGGYQIPRGGMFELVSCPHYLGEIVIYLGLALLTWPAIRPRLMLLWVVVNLVLAAGPTHRWYHTTFPEYPRQRKALIPWLF